MWLTPGRQLEVGARSVRLTIKRKPYPFSLPILIDKVEGAVLVDHIQSMDWPVRKAAFHSNVDPALLNKVRA